MSLKGDKINELCMRLYTDVEDIYEVEDPKLCQEIANKVYKLINESHMNHEDCIKLLKNMTINAIDQSVSGYFEYLEKESKDKFKEDMK